MKEFEPVGGIVLSDASGDAIREVGSVGGGLRGEGVRNGLEIVLSDASGVDGEIAIRGGGI